MKRQALVALALVAAFVAVAIVARSERVYSVGEVRSAFASVGTRLALPRPFGLLPACPSAWSPRRWGFWSRPLEWCPYAIFVTRGRPAVVYVFPSESDAARYVDPRWAPRYELVARRANVVVFAERRDPALDAALAALG